MATKEQIKEAAFGLRVINVQIKAGKTTCGSGDGTFCKHCSWRVGGGQENCDIYGPLKTSEPNSEGWILRHPDCLAGETAVTQLTDTAYAQGYAQCVEDARVAHAQGYKTR